MMHEHSSYDTDDVGRDDDDHGLKMPKKGHCQSHVVSRFQGLWRLMMMIVL